MENANKIMFMGLSVLLFSMAIVLAVSMYGYVYGIIENTGETVSVRKVLEGE